MEHTFLKNLKIADSFRGVYFIEQLVERTAKNGKKYTDLTLRDRSGSILVRLWNRVPEDTVKGAFVDVVGRVEDYQGNPQTTIDSVMVVPNPEDLSNYLAISSTRQKDPEKFENICTKIGELSKEANIDVCQNIVEQIFTQEVKDRFFDAPFGVLPTYGKIGGLLSHTIRVTTLAFDMAKPHALTVRERLVLITASLVHGIGAIDRFSFENLLPIETTQGILLGRLNLSLFRLEQALALVNQSTNPDSQNVAMLLKHAVAVNIYPNSLRPMTREAVILYEAFRADYAIVEAIDFVAQDTATGEFTALDPVAKRRFYKG